MKEISKSPREIIDTIISQSRISSLQNRTSLCFSDAREDNREEKTIVEKRLAPFAALLLLNEAQAFSIFGISANLDLFLPNPWAFLAHNKDFGVTGLNCETLSRAEFLAGSAYELKPEFYAAIFGKTSCFCQTSWEGTDTQTVDILSLPAEKIEELKLKAFSRKVFAGEDGETVLTGKFYVWSHDYTDYVVGVQAPPKEVKRK